MQQESTYPMDAENAAEMARLVRQARLISHLTGLLPISLTPFQQGSVLDLGCGPGEWVLALADQYRAIEFMGIDSSQMMTSYARFLARERDLPHAHFRVMDVTQHLGFDD